MDLKKMYQQSLENAFELTKIAKTKEDVCLAKADIYAKIALAIATSMVEVEDTNESANASAVPVTAVPKVKEEVKPEANKEPVEQNVDPKVAVLANDEGIPLPPDHMEEEEASARKARYDYLLSKYKDTLLKDLPEDVHPYLMPEANVNAVYEYLWNEALKDNADKRKESIVRDFTDNKATSVGDVTLALYLEKIIPCEQHWIYFMMFEDPNTINETLAKCTSNRYKDFRNLSNFSVDVWHTATQKYMENNFEAIEKVS